jgi:hypothetical protein
LQHLGDDPSASSSSLIWIGIGAFVILVSVAILLGATLWARRA